MGLLRQDDSLSLVKLIHGRMEVICQNAPRHAVDGYVMTDEQQTVTVGSMQQHGTENRAMFQIDEFSLTKGVFRYVLGHFILFLQRLFVESEQMLVGRGAYHDGAANNGGAQHVVVYGQCL